MMKSLRFTILTMFCTLFFSLTFVGFAQAGFNPLGEACKAGETNQSSICKEKSSTEDPITGTNGILVRAIRVLTIAVGIASVIMIIVGGLKFILSDGNGEKAASGRKTVIYAVVGLVIAVLAGAITQFLTDRAL